MKFIQFFFCLQRGAQMFLPELDLALNSSVCVPKLIQVQIWRYKLGRDEKPFIIMNERKNWWADLKKTLKSKVIFKLQKRRTNSFWDNFMKFNLFQISISHSVEGMKFDANKPHTRKVGPSLLQLRTHRTILFFRQTLRFKLQFRLKKYFIRLE